MESIKSLSVDEFLAGLSPVRQEAIVAVRDVILANLPEGYVETVDLRSISYCVPPERFSKTYNREPLTLAGLSPRKGYISLFLIPFFWDLSLREWFQEEFRKTGKTLEMGKGCVRFRRADDLPLDLIGKVIGLVSLDKYVSFYQATHSKAKRVPRTWPGSGGPDEGSTP